MSPKVKVGIDLDDSLASKRYRIKPPSDAVVKIGRIIGDDVEEFIVIRGSFRDTARYASSTFSRAQKIKKGGKDILSGLNEK